jgi:hypothetical protein
VPSALQSLLAGRRRKPGAAARPSSFCRAVAVAAAAIRIRPMSTAGRGSRAVRRPILPQAGSASRVRYPAAARASDRPSIFSHADSTRQGWRDWEEERKTSPAGPGWLQNRNVCTSSHPPPSSTPSWVAVYGPNGSVTPWLFPTALGKYLGRRPCGIGSGAGGLAGLLVDRDCLDARVRRGRRRGQRGAGGEVAGQVPGSGQERGE